MFRFGAFLIGILSTLEVVASQQVVLDHMKTTAQQAMDFMNSGSNDTSSYPPIVIGSLPHWSHVEKLTLIAQGLVEKGYQVTYVTSL